MRSLRIGEGLSARGSAIGKQVRILAPLLLALALGLVAAPSRAALWQSTLYGSVTQAPIGNPFGVSVGDSVLARLIFEFPNDPIIPNDPVFPNDPLRVFVDSASFEIGNTTYTRLFRLGDTQPFLDFDLGLVINTSLTFLPPSPILPLLNIIGNPQFFTGGSCTADAVCGQLFTDLSAPVLLPDPTPVPEPAGIGLLALAFAALGLRRRFRRTIGASAGKR